MKKGFTLIELLVVVLIIGILSAVAMPQYTKAVEKARAAEAISMVRAIRDAQQIYYMANGYYSNKVEDLDIEVMGKDGGIVSGSSRRESKYFSYGAAVTDDHSGIMTSIAVGNRLPISSMYSIVAKTDGRLLCKYYSPEGEYICKTLGTPIDSPFYLIK
ncbi:MAG: prepilin-type N-terminal cleavage/methylation domain-containing protein [Elusimicrobiaceae bacterium]|nr:prepilin-type N-terminal cleavage/methylation domain-containing protein [Elusimicrobiaceae bacterium]